MIKKVFVRGTVILIMSGIILVLFAVYAGGLQERKSYSTYFDDSDALDVSLVQLIANPSLYHGKRVRVIGVSNVENTLHAVYMSDADWKYLIHKNGLWLDIPKDSAFLERVQEYNGQYVVIEGMFDMNHAGQFNMWGGMIHQITRYELR